MTVFRPCIDLHEGKVKQIVGSSLKDTGAGLRTNFETDRSPAYFAKLYQKDGLRGGHVIMLGKGNETAAKEALSAYPGGLDVGGGINPDNAKEYLDAGAAHIIVTSWLFAGGELDMGRVRTLSKAVSKDRLVLDLSCKRTGDGWNVATDRWQTVTSCKITEEALETLGGYCDGFLIHAADVEGMQRGMDEELIAFLAKESPVPVTYAGGARGIEDLERCARISEEKVDLTIGSALDIFGGKGIRYEDCVKFNNRRR